MKYNEICEQCLYNDVDPDICNKGGRHKKRHPGTMDPSDCIEGFCRKSEYDKWPKDTRDKMAEESGEFWKSMK